jgi:hypothetical protein
MRMMNYKELSLIVPSGTFKTASYLAYIEAFLSLSFDAHFVDEHRPAVIVGYDAGGGGC